MTKLEMERLSEEEFIEKCAFIMSLDFIDPPAYSDDEERMLDLAIITSAAEAREAKSPGSAPEANSDSDHSDSDSPAPPRPPSTHERAPEPEAPRMEHRNAPGRPKIDDMPELEVLRRIDDVAWPIATPIVGYDRYWQRDSSSSSSSSSDSDGADILNFFERDNVINRPPPGLDIENTFERDNVINRPPSEDQLVMRDQDAEYQRALEEAQRRETERRNQEIEDQRARMEEQEAQKREEDQRATMKEIALTMPEPEQGSLIAFTMPNGERIRRRFEPDTMGEFVWLFVAGQPQMQAGDKTADFVLKWAGGQLDRNKTLAEQKIGDRMMLQVILD